MTPTEHSKPMTARDIVEFNAFLNNVMMRDDDNEGIFKYKDLWDDNRVQKEFKHGKFSLYQIRKNRIGLGYRLPKSPSYFTVIIDKHNMLIDALITWLSGKEGVSISADDFIKMLEDSRITRDDEA